MTRDAASRHSYVDFEITIGRRRGRIYPVALHSPIGNQDVRMHFLSKEMLGNHLRNLEMAILRSATAYRLAPDDDRLAVESFGQSLFDSLFPGEIRNLYLENVRDAERQGQGLRLKLRIEDPRLASLPWEFLYDPENHVHIGLSASTPIVRDLGQKHQSAPLMVDPPLRILGMTATPEGTVALNASREQQQIHEALKPLEDRGMVKLHWLSGQSWPELQEALWQDVYHVFHFLGHGGYNDDRDEGYILFSGQAGEPQRVSASQLAVLLRDAKLRLAVLNSCTTAMGGENDLFASTASILLREGGLPAVLAMQFPISDTAAIELSRTFYAAIADGLPVEAAVAEARKAVLGKIPGTLEWATPSLYQHAPDGVLFELGPLVTSTPSETVDTATTSLESAGTAASALPQLERMTSPKVESGGTNRTSPVAGILTMLFLVAVVYVMLRGTTAVLEVHKTHCPPGLEGSNFYDAYDSCDELGDADEPFLLQGPDFYEGSGQTEITTSARVQTPGPGIATFPGLAMGTYRLSHTGPAGGRIHVYCYDATLYPNGGGTVLASYNGWAEDLVDVVIPNAAYVVCDWISAFKTGG